MLIIILNLRRASSVLAAQSLAAANTNASEELAHNSVLLPNERAALVMAAVLLQVSLRDDEEATRRR
jgi:hypothetical protein